MCRFVFWAFVLAYGFALFVLLVGTLGLFGQARDPLSAVYLVPLGLPWNLLLDGAPDSVRPWLAALAPALNVALIGALCRWLATK